MITGSCTQKETYIYAKRNLTELPGATLSDPVISGAAFFRATALRTCTLRSKAEERGQQNRQIFSQLQNF
jgi:hypothetical protein